MNKKFLNILTKIGIFFASIYLLFLILPFLLLPVLNAFNSKISTEIEKATKFKVELNKIRIVTTPKLTVGAKIGDIKVYQPNGKLFVDAQNVQGKVSLLPLLAKKIEVDMVGADKVNLNLYVQKNGLFFIETYISQLENLPAEPVSKPSEPIALPFGFKLSNKLPDIKIKSHEVNFIEPDGKKYSLTGEDTNIIDFIINKKIKFNSKGELNLDGYKAFTYDVDIYNKVMPDIDINDLLQQSSSTGTAEVSQENFSFNIIDFFKLVKKHQLGANLVADITIDGDFNNLILNGDVVLSDLSMLLNGKKLPNSNVDLKLKNDSIDLNSQFNSSESEATNLIGKFNIGRNKKISVNCKSNASLKSIFDIINTFAQIAGINDLKTLSAKGQIDADFNINSDLKKVESNGYFKLNEGLISYGLFNVKIQDIISDIKLDNNTVLINKLGFSTFGVPFNIFGKITPEADVDLKVQTNNLSLKGLLVSLGQANLLKENPVNNGLITILIDIKDKLFQPKITGNIQVKNLDVKNIPADLRLTLNPVDIKLNTTKTGFEGIVDVQNIKVVNPALTVDIPKILTNIDENKINLSDTLVKIGKNSITVNGVVSDYLTDKVDINLSTKGDIISKLTGNLDPYKMTLNLNYNIPASSKLVIPGFDKSLAKFTGNINIVDSMLNPSLKGNIVLSSVEIPEIPVSISDMTVNLNGPILVGNVLIDKFATGGIKANNIKSDIKLSGVNFYLNNLVGSAFDGNFIGNIIYNLSNAKCDVKFKGDNMSALKAIEGAVGIKNALTGTLKFDADVNLKALDYDTMMKSLKGVATFEILDGTLGNIGGLKTLLNAQNLISNNFFKAAADKTSSLSAVSKSSEFDYIKGKINFNNAYALIDFIDISGPLMSYHVSGKLNLLNFTTNVTILGRLSEEIVGGLGAIGDFATEKLTSAIPALGSFTSQFAKSLNVSPKDVDMTKIPKLTDSTVKYKEFKVDFNGGIESNNSVKSFKWINDIDTSAIENTQAQSAINQINSAKQMVQNSIKDAKVILNSDIDVTKTKEQAKQLFKSLISVPTQN